MSPDFEAITSHHIWLPHGSKKKSLYCWSSDDDA